jgi:hypothetical protein
MSAQPRIGPTGRVVASPYVRSRRLDGDLVMIDLDHGEYFALDPVGAQMWELLISGKTPTDVAEVLSVEYDAERADILRDCTNLVNELIERGLLRLETR